MTQRLFWARSSAELKVIQILLYASYDRAGETPIRPPSIYRQASAYSSSIFGTRSHSGYTSELAGRILPGPRMSASGALALVKRVFFFFFFFSFFCRLSVQNITHHMTKLYSSKDPKLK